jgi:cell filamentation protein
MALGGYDAFNDPYAYEGTDVLINKLDLRDPALLEAFESEMTTLRANEPLPDGSYDVLHYKRIHYHIFQDVYSWAGECRTVRTSKGGNSFCFPEHIDSEMRKLFRQLDNESCLSAQESDEFIAATAHFLAELNAIHPFREGNGRSQLAFVHLLGEKAGFPLDFSRVLPETFLPAMIESYHGRLEPLIGELRQLLS